MLSLVQSPATSGGLVWDIGNALGYAAYAVLLYLFVETGAGQRRKIHQWLSYFALGAVIVHIVVLWLPNTTIWHYLGFDAPVYMLMGLLAVLALVLITVISLPQKRRYWHANHKFFRALHEWLAIAVLGAAFWHISASGFYISTLESTLLLITTLLIYGLKFASLLPRSELTFPAACAGCMVFPTLFVALKALL